VSKRKAQPKKSPLPLVALIAGGTLLIVAAIYFSFQGGEQDSGTPLLSIDQQVIDFGDVKLDTTVSFAITVTNNGDGVLRFTDEPSIQVVEGC